MPGGSACSISFADATIVGAEINSRARKIAVRRFASDTLVKVIGPRAIEGSFDIVFALAVLQRQPHVISEMAIDDLSAHYPFKRFDDAVRKLVKRLRPGGLLCVINVHYPIEESSVGHELEPVEVSGDLEEPLFGRDGRRLNGPVAKTIFRKRSHGSVPKAC